MWKHVAPHAWFVLGARLNQTDLQPYVQSSELELQDTEFPLLPSCIPLHHPGMSVFFAGTRYDALHKKGFQDVRKALGKIVSACAPTPGFTDVLLILQSFPLFMHSNLYEQYRAYEGTRRVHAMFKALDSLMQHYAHHIKDAIAKGTEPVLISFKEYDALGAMKPYDALLALQERFRKRGADANDAGEDTFIVYGRYKPSIASGAKPCPFTVKAVDALLAAKLQYEVVEVLSAADAIVPMTKPAAHTTVPVVFIRRGDAGIDDALEFIGGFTDLQSLLSKK